MVDSKRILPAGLDSVSQRVENIGMVIPGRVHNGVVVLEGGSALPEGAAVTVSYPAPVAAAAPGEKRRVEFPLVRNGAPGTWNLTNEQIAEILEEEDIAALKGKWNVPS